MHSIHRFVHFMNIYSFHAKLLDARVAKGMSQTDLAVAAGIAPGQISRYEQGKNTPRPHVMAKLAAALGVDPAWLSKPDTTPVLDVTSTPRADGGLDLSFKLDPETAADLKREAAERGITPGDLLKALMLDRLAESMKARNLSPADIESIAFEVKKLLASETSSNT